MEIISENKENIWNQVYKFKKTDWIPLSFMWGSIIILWIFIFFLSSLKNISSFKEGLINYFIGKTIYDINQKSIFESISISSNEMYSLPFGLPILLKFFSIFTFGYWFPLMIFFVFLSSGICVLLFERFLTIWNLVNNPIITSSLLSIYPMRLILYHSVPTSDNLFLIFLFLSFISYKFRNFKVLFWSIVLSCFFNQQGYVLSFSFFINFFKSGLYSKSFKILFASFLGTLPLLIVQFINTNSFLTFFINHFILSKNYSLLPLKIFFEGALSIEFMTHFQTNYILYGSCILGILFISNFSILFVIYPIISILFISSMNYVDIYRSSVSLEIFTILIGFDSFFNSTKFKKINKIFLIFYLIAGYILSINNYIDGSKELF